MPLKLVVRFGGEHVKTYTLGEETVFIGRDPDCTVHIDNLGVSRKHAKVELNGDIYQLVDLASNNGTFVRGDRITQYNLNHGDEFSTVGLRIHARMMRAHSPDTDHRTPQRSTAHAPSSLTGSADVE